MVSINGVFNANSSGYNWQYWVNDELAPIAADNYILSDSDQVLWKYCAPETLPEFPAPFAPELIFGLAIIGCVGAITVCAAILINRKLR